MNLVSPPPPRTKEPTGGKAKRLAELSEAGFPVPEFLCDPVDAAAALETLGAPVVVRSSASAEDGRALSFAGQFKSTLNLRTPLEVKHAIADSRRSLDTPSVKEYCRRNGIAHAELRMGVIVQRMIENPELAGVAFTIDPMTGRDEVVIEASHGLADELLAGHVPALPADDPVLVAHTPAIERLAREVQRHYGEPQDIEFAIADGELYLLQARPVTRIRFQPGVGEWTNADFRDGGVSCSVCTPLMWSLYEFVWQESLNGFLREIKLLKKGTPDFLAGRLFYGRPYWNLGEVKKCLARLPGFNERRFDEDLQVRGAGGDDGLVTPTTLLGILRALPTVAAVPKLWKAQAAFDKTFLEDKFKTLAAPFERLPAGAELDAAFRDLVQDVFRRTETNYFRTIFCASLAKLDFGEAFPEATDTALVAGLPPIAHLEPLRAMRAMAAEGRIDIPEIMRRFRHHSRNELDLRALRWDQDPEWVESLAANLPPEPSRDPAATYRAALERELARLPRRKRKSFHRKLERLRHFLWLREEMRDLSTRIYYLIRKYALAIAEERGLGDDIFFMSWAEILADDRSNIDRARATFQSWRHFDAPNEIGARATLPPPHEPGTAIPRGIAASPGRVTGPAAVVRTIEEARSAPAGAILVCPFTDPGWTLVLAKVAGVVTENGGLLSHAAVICREYGLPAVLGVAQATTRIPNGALLEIDGDQGTVTPKTNNEAQDLSS